MKFRIDCDEKILITLEILDYNIHFRFVDHFNNINIYIVKVFDTSYISRCKCKTINYLDRFILLMPESNEEKRKIWLDFYHYFAVDYEELIDKGNNLNCIKAMIDYIEKSLLSSEYCCLDYGCGTGLSSMVRTRGKIVGYEPVETMRQMAQKRGMHVYTQDNIIDIPDNSLDAVFASYIFHMDIEDQDIVRIFPKLKENALWIANFYKRINEESINILFHKNGFYVKRLEEIEEGRFGTVYEYRR